MKIIYIFSFLSFIFLCFHINRTKNCPNGSGSSKDQPGARWRDFCGFLFILLLAITVRTLAFGRIPNGVHVDEAASGYDAFALLNYGMDMNGYTNPVVLVGFGSGHDALYSYFSMPFITWLGLNQVSIRLANLLVGILSLFMFYFLVARINGKTTGLIALFLLAINPWHIMISRWGLECNLFPGIFLLATLLMIFSIEKPFLFPVSMAIYGLSLYAYATSYFVLPLFLLLSILVLLKYKKIHLRHVLIGAIIFATFTIPIALYVIINQFDLQPIQTGWITIPRTLGATRFDTVSTLSSFETFLSSAGTNARQLIELLIFQDDSLIQNSVPGFGFAYLFSLPFMLAGVWILVKDLFSRRTFDPRMLMLTWLAAALMLGLTFEANINRMNILFLPLIYLVAVAIEFLQKRSRILTIAGLLMFLVGFTCFSRSYFEDYPRLSSTAFNESLHEAIGTAVQKTEGIVYLSRRIHLPYIHILFSQRMDPNEFLDLIEYEDPFENTRDAVGMGRFRFSHVENMPLDGDAYIIENRERESFNLDDFEVIPFNNFTLFVASPIMKE